jgi:tetratricopeptide (TPR) repeat protein
MPRPNRPWSVRAVRAIDRLRRRREVEWLALYLGAAWIIYEAAGLTVDTFNLPVTVLRITAVLLGLGVFVAIPLAHWYELTARALEQAGGGELGDVRGVPDVFESALARSYKNVRSRTVVLASAGSTVLFSGLFLVLWTAWASGHERPVTDPRLSMAIFPFRSVGVDGAAYGEGLADLLSASLDGTPGVRVSDPAALWEDLRPDRDATAQAPDPEEALRLSRVVGAQRYVTGSVTAAGANLDVTARVYDAATGEVVATVNAAGPVDSLRQAAQRVAIDVLASVWQRDRIPGVAEIDRFATANAEALKAYLEAKSLARRGLFQQAQPAIERAVALDSTFALAYLEQFTIRSRVLYLNAEPFIGLRPIIDKAMAHRERLTPRNRMRIEANRALDDTDGSQAAFLFERILSIDSLDIDALQGLAFTYLRDGWMLGKRNREIVAAYDRLLAVDSASIMGRATRAQLAFLSDDPAELRRALDNLRAVDTTSSYALGTLGSIKAMLATGWEVDSILRAMANQPIPIVTTTLRELRAYRPALAERFLDELMVDSMPVTHRAVGSGARAQIWFAEGRLAGVDSLLRAGEYAGFPMLINRHFVSSFLAGVGDSSITARAIADLKGYLTPDSLAYYFEERPTWSVGWSVGAYEATVGDTAAAAVWQRALEGLPGGGTPLDYRAALSADIEARLAVRRDDLDAAVEQGRIAYEGWGIHSNDSLHDFPEYGMRFHLAEIYRSRGETERAEWLYRSFIPPHGWVGFYAPRASFELGRIEEERGNREEALKHYLRAVRLWERGDPEVVGRWLARAQEALARLGGERTAD